MTLAARLVAGQIERRLQPTAMRRIGAVMACAQSLSSTLQGDRWTALRHGLDVTTSCPSLMRELYPRRSQRLALGARVSSVGSRLLKQEGFRELLMSGAKTLIRL